jgi:hypothetical protein
MSGQLSLFGETAEEEKIETKSAKKDVVPQIDIIAHTATKYGVDQFEGIVSRTVHTITLLSSTNITGTEYGIDTKHEGVLPRGILGSYTGYGGGDFDFRDKISIQNFFDELMEEKKDSLKKMYREFTKDELKIGYDHEFAYYGFRHIPADNFFVVISDKLLTLMQETGFDFDEWYIEYKSIFENEATLKSWDLVLEKLKLLEEGNDVKKEAELVGKIIKAFNETGKEEYFNMTLDEMKEKLKELGEDLYDISSKINEIGEYLRGKSVDYREFWFTLDKLNITTGYGKVKV